MRPRSSPTTPASIGFSMVRATRCRRSKKQGLNEFRSGGSQCTRCHQGPELSAAGFTTARNGNPLDPRDLGFFRTGVSAIEDDVGAAGTDGFGLPIFPAAPTSRGDGAFKSPGLRNVELTGPYFHTGGFATLEQVMEFYARNGDVPAGGNLGPGMGNIRLNAQDRAELVAFLKALTDDRVRFEQAPFDHPALCVPVGHAETAPGVLTPGYVGTGEPFGRRRSVGAGAGGGSRRARGAAPDLPRAAGGNRPRRLPCSCARASLRAVIPNGQLIPTE